MQIWIAFLKGVNVGGKNKLPMKQLVNDLESTGLSDVKTYIQSGNLVFRSSAKRAVLAADIAATIKGKSGFEPHVAVLSLADLTNAEKANPFSADDAQSKLLHFFFLSAAPVKIDLVKLESIRRASEEWHVEGTVLYLHTPEGFGDSKLATQIEKIFNVTATARNLRTVRALIELAKTSG